MTEGIKQTTRHLWRFEKLRFLVVGGCNAVLCYGEFAILFHLLWPLMHYMAVLVIVTIANVSTSYLTQKFFVFRTKGNYFREYPRFYLVNGISIVISFVGFPFCREVLGMNPYLIQVILMAATMVINYFGHKHISFRQPS